MELVVLWLRLLAPSEIPLQRLAERAPQAMAKLVLSHTEPFKVNFAAVADRLGAHPTIWGSGLCDDEFGQELVPGLVDMVCFQCGDGRRSGL